MTFDDLEFKPHYLGGDWGTAFFPNGQGASVIRTKISKGWPDLWEVAVLRGDRVGHCRIDVSTDITDDTVGWLSEDGVTELLQRIEALPPVEESLQ